MRADKNSSRRRWKLQQDEHGNQARLRLNYPSWSRPRSHWSATGPRNQQLNHTPQTHNQKQSSLLSVSHRSDRWLLSVRPMAPVRLVDSVGQASGKQKMHNNVPVANRRCTKTTTKNTIGKEGNPSQNLANQLRTSQ
jgi:hypothetical protein